MQITSVSSTASGAYQTSTAKSFAKLKQDFDDLGQALQAGNLTAAKTAFTQLQAAAPAQDGKASKPLNAIIDSLGKALDAGDLNGAKEAYSQIKAELSHRAPGSARQGGGGGPAGGGQKPGGAGGSQSTKSYDKKDANKDGVVTVAEELAYDLMHPAEVKQTQQAQPKSGSTASPASQTTLDVEA